MFLINLVSICMLSQFDHSAPTELLTSRAAKANVANILWCFLGVAMKISQQPCNCAKLHFCILRQSMKIVKKLLP